MLLAEAREIKRIPNQVKSGRVKVKHVPQFKLGTGHVHFFTDRLGYLLKRYQEVYQECLRRGFKVQDYSSAWDGVPTELMNDYEPTVRDLQIVKNRIIERLVNNINIGEQLLKLTVEQQKLHKATLLAKEALNN